MPNPLPARMVLLGNDPGDRQWSMLGYGKHLEETLRKIAGGEKQYAYLNPDTRPYGDFWRRWRVGRSGVLYLSRHLFYPRLLREIRGDLFHILDHGNSCLIRYLDPARTVVTCHDLIPLVLQSQSDSLFPWFSERAFRTAVSGLSLAARILAVSHSTKSDLIRLLQIPSHRIEVVSNGIGDFFHPPADASDRQRARSEFRFPDGALLLHVGQPTFYKNIEGILRALEILRRRNVPCWLVRASGSFRKSQAKLADRLGVSDRIIELGILSQARLVRAYHAADLLLFPSWYEGFGLPPLEAMACGLPVVASDKGALRETLGTSALIVQPETPDHIADTVEHLIKNSDLQADLQTRGFLHAAPFTWKRTAEQTLAVYESVLCYTSSRKQGNPL